MADTGSGKSARLAAKAASVGVVPAPQAAATSQNLAHLRLSRLWTESRQELEELFAEARGGASGRMEDWGDFELFFERYLGFLQRQQADYGLLRHQVGSRNEQDRAMFQNVLLLYEEFLEKQEKQRIEQLKATVKGLPVAASREQIVAAVMRHPVVLVAGDTGCGKSTQVPQFLFEAGFKNIVVTQPRRIAAVSLARRVALERTHVAEAPGQGGEVVGHQIRFDTTRSARTRLLFVTEGILLRLLEVNVRASEFTVVIIDEVHERHLPVDLLLGVLRKVVAELRRDLKLVLMSATLQKDAFIDFFRLDASAVVDVPGRCFPVEVEHIELPDEPQAIRNDVLRRQKRRSDFKCAPFMDVLRRIDARTDSQERGDVLIFVPGAYEIDMLVDAVAELAARSKRWVALPLHSQLPLEQQERVFDVAPPGVRKVVVATNIAETSVTIDGVRFVVDGGKMKELDVDTISCVRHLAERWESQASAEQRKGRAGRTGPGRCFRLYSQRLFGEMEPFTVPEIQRVALETALLQVLALGFELHSFRFPEAPRAEAVAAAILRLLLMRAVVRVPVDFSNSSTAWQILQTVAAAGSAFAAREGEGGAGSLRAGGWSAGFGLKGADRLLHSLGLLLGSAPTSQLALTPLGRVLSRLPVDVGVGKMLLLALVFSVQHVAVVLASAANLHSPRAQRRGERLESAWRFDHNLGDLFTTLRVYQAWLRERCRRQGGGADGGRGGDEQSRRWAREHGVDEAVLFELNKLNVQLCDLLREGAAAAPGAGRGLGAQLRQKKMGQLEGLLAGGLSEAERQALQAELEELRQLEGQRQRRLLALDEGEGVLAEDERGLGYAAEQKELGGWDSDGEMANASGGEGNPNRELNRRKRRPKPGAGPRRVKLPRNDGLPQRMRKRNIEFELKYGSHTHTLQALEDLTKRQEELLQLVVACALYPNLALPHEKNHERGAAECIFHTRQVPFANLHPNSALFAQLPEALGVREGLAFGAILQTQMPYLTHVTRCPVLPVVLLSASRVDTAPDGKLLICDEWLQLVFEDATEVLTLLAEAHVLRRAMQRALDTELMKLFEASCDDDVPEGLLESAEHLPVDMPPRLREALGAIVTEQLQGKALEERALAFWRRKPRYRWQTLMPNEYGAFRTGAKDEDQKGSTSASRWLWYGTISETNLRPESALLSDHLAMAWTCPTCRHTFRFTRGDIAKHRRECVDVAEEGVGSQPRQPAALPGSGGSGDEGSDVEGGDDEESGAESPAADKAAPATAPRTAGGGGAREAREAREAPGDDSAARGMWRCERCGTLVPSASAFAILRHRRSHGL